MDSTISSALHQAREQHALSIATVATHLGVRAAVLEELEQGGADEAASSVSAQAHLRVYARFLGFDAEAVLVGHPAGTPSRSSAAATLASRRPTAHPSPSPRGLRPAAELAAEPEPRGETAPPASGDEPAAARHPATTRPPLVRTSSPWSPWSTAAPEPRLAHARHERRGQAFFDEGDDTELPMGDDPSDSRRRIRALLILSGLLVVVLSVWLLASMTDAGPAFPVEGAAAAGAALLRIRSPR
jgi:hypothetical protein